MNLDLEDKVVVIAGGSKGIGKSIAHAFLNEGAKVSVCGRDNYALEQAIQLFSEKKEKFFPKNLDVLIGEDYSLWLKEIIEKWGKIDIFIWNISAQSSLWEECFQTDIKSCVECVEKILPYLKKSNMPAIVTIASESASRGIPKFKAYSATKAALIHYMTSLALELVPDKVRVNCVSPSEVYSIDGIWDKIKDESPERYERALGRTAWGRMAEPEEVANAVVFLASPRASYISGTNLIIDAGAHQYINL